VRDIINDVKFAYLHLEIPHIVNLTNVRVELRVYIKHIKVTKFVLFNVKKVIVTTT